MQGVSSFERLYQADITWIVIAVPCLPWPGRDNISVGSYYTTNTPVSGLMPEHYYHEVFTNKGAGKAKNLTVLLPESDPGLILLVLLFGTLLL